MDETIDTGEDTVVREIAAWGENPEQQFSRDELGGLLDSAVRSLEPLYRSVFVLRDIEEQQRQRELQQSPSVPKGSQPAIPPP